MMRLLVLFGSTSEYFWITALSLCMCQRVRECDYVCTYSYQAFCLICRMMFCWTCPEMWLKRACVTKSDSQITAFVTSFDVLLLHGVMCKLHVCVVWVLYSPDGLWLTGPSSASVCCRAGSWQQVVRMEWRWEHRKRCLVFRTLCRAEWSNGHGTVSRGESMLHSRHTQYVRWWNSMMVSEYVYRGLVIWVVDQACWWNVIPVEYWPWSYKSTKFTLQLVEKETSICLQHHRKFVLLYIYLQRTAKPPTTVQDYVSTFMSSRWIFLKWNSRQKATEAFFVIEYEANLCVKA